MAFFRIHTICVFTASLIVASPAVGEPTKLASLTAEKNDILLLTVDKANLVAELHSWPENPVAARVIRSFKVAIGKADGDKERRGDNKTPEGIYVASEQIKETLPAEKYGPKAIGLDYPNPMDHADGKSGYGIWLHGAGDDKRISESKATEGCVAFYNAEIQELAGILRPFHTLVVIAKDLTMVNRPDEVASLKAATEDWLKAWNARDLDRYISHYSEAFEHTEGKVEKFKKYKEAVFKSYQTMSVKGENIRVITHPKYALSIMNQDFRGDDRYTAVGRKLLYWKRDGSGWKIVREIFNQREFTVLSSSASSSALNARQAAGSTTETYPPSSL